MAPPIEPGSRSFTVPVWVIAGAAAGAGLLLGLALALLAGDTDGTGAAGVGRTNTPGATEPARATATAQSPAPHATQTPEPSESSAPSASVRSMGIYYLAEQEDGEYRLYREFREVTVTDSRPIAAAVDAMFQLDPLDADYLSPWPAASRVIATAKSGDLATVDLSADAIDSTVPDEDVAAAAVQQLVHTATAADPSVRRVRILVNGAPLTEFWGLPLGQEPLTRAAASSALGPVWVIDPGEGATVGRTFTATGTAEVFEATVSYEVTSSDGELVADGSITADLGTGGRGNWSRRFTLEPGTYLLRFFYHSAENGEPRGADTKTIKVR